ncbi:hypothetical protein IV203_032278 [Nitzschia inconspicua]|uniref:Uncharacterized protein n=1 Tax=Nitzschia inconspicua TaxID=303405 RepID=A0A9K3KJ82_9STRA|nr:hypothetical protein IV203_032278 [Nitzschia inconspicua]
MAASSLTVRTRNNNNPGSWPSSLVFLLQAIVFYFVLCILQSAIVSNAFGPSTIGTSFHRMGFCAPPSLVSRTALGVYPPCCDNESTRKDESTSKAINGGGEDYQHSSSSSRRDLLIHGVRSFVIPAAAAVWTTTITTADGSTFSVAHAASSSPTNTVKELLTQLQQADQQMNDIPKLIDGEKWDSVRAILIAPPLSDCWAKTNRPLVQKYAQALGDAGGDELAALEAKEELEGRLRYLDMAVYNNNFNPITVEGTTNASPTLIQSYYEDPQREYKASRKALQELIQLAKDVGL